MPYKFNPFTNALDYFESGGGGGASYIDGEVQNFSALPETLGTPPVDSAYLVREAEGTWLLNRKPAGIYIRTANTGTRASDWTHAGAFPDVFNDANFLLYDDADSTKNLAFQLSGITTGTTRTLTAPDASGRIQVEGQAIGDTTPAAGTFTTLNSTIASGAGITVTDTNTSTDYNNLIECVRDSTVRFSVRDDGSVNAFLGLNVSTNVGLVTASGGNGGVRIRADYSLHWVSTGFINTGTPDTFLRRDAQANTLAMYNSTNAQEFRLYNTRTSSTNFERLSIGWASNTVSIKPEAGGAGGTVRELHISGLPSSNPGPGILWNDSGTVKVGT
jgi:hypothetical protein